MIILSLYTDREHERALSETLYWRNKKPLTKEEEYEYGEYEFRLKDYKEAVKWYEKAAEKSYIPAMYKLAYCMKNNLGTFSNIHKEEALFKEVILRDLEVESVEGNYRLGMCYTYGYGIEADEKRGALYFSKAENFIDAIYEIGVIYKEGKGGYSVDKKKAEDYFCMAYDGFYEDAIFKIFEMYTGEFEKFPYIREIKEAYSFKLGRLIRASELKPSKEYLKRLADFYKKGHPGDTGEKLEKFQRIAEKYYRKVENTYVE